MITRQVILILFIQIIVQNSFTQETTNDEKLRKLISIYGQAEVRVPYPGPEAIDFLSRNVSIRSVKDNCVDIVLSPLTAEWFISSGFSYNLIEPSRVKGIVSSSNMKKAMEWDSYPTYSQYDSIMRFFAEEYPSLCRLDTIGTTLEGRLVMVLKISDNCNEDEDEPEVFLTSTMHGDETGGFILMLRLADYLLSNYDSDFRIRELADNVEIWINPLANPDGTYTNGNEIYMPVRGNAAGYDLNRNFPDPLISGTVLQKETIDMMKFLAERRFVLSANFHSGAEVVNYPWDRWVRDHADRNWFYSVSRAYADTAHNYSPPGYMDYLDNGVTNGYRWYPVYGSRQDYVTWELHGREITIEIDEDFITPVYDLHELWSSNWRSMLGFIENALFGIHGSVTDAENGKPVPATIRVNGHDKDRSEAYADSTTGSFFRFLSPGIWDLSFSASGYRDTTISDIVVSAFQKTSMAVTMKKIMTGVDTSETGQPVLYPNPAGGFLKAELPGNLSGNINIRIFNTAGVLLYDYDDFYADGIPLYFDVMNMKRGIYIVRFTFKETGRIFHGKFILK